MAILYPVSGRPVGVRPAHGRSFDLLEIHQLVEDVKGDGIDWVRVSSELVMFVRENSFWELPANPAATAFVVRHRPDYQWVIHGPALVMDLIESGDID